jgi:cytochrome c biogenesis protein CcmG, thiol:disulfide interchange protein DsbE
MKKTLVTLMLIATLALASSLPAVALTSRGEQAPDFTLTTLDGSQEISLSELAGKVVYIDFWASWCGPCRKALPEVQALWNEYKGENFQMLGVNLDRKVEAGLKYVQSKNVSFPSVYDEGGSVSTSYGVRSIPSMIIIGPDGKVAFSEVGFNPQRVPDIKKVIEGLLGSGVGSVEPGPSSRSEVKGGRSE